MNLVGKIFTVCIFVMSLVFASFSIMVYATHTNWKDEIERKTQVGNKGIGWKERDKLNKEEIARLTNERNDLELKLTGEKQALSQALAKVESEYQSLQKKFVTVNEQLVQKDKDLDSSTNTLKTAQDNLTQATGEVTKLRDANASLQKETDAQIKKAIDLADKLAKSNGDLTVVKERNEQMTLDLDNARRLLQSVGMTIKDPSDANRIPVSGKITSIGRDKVEISIGMDDGVRVGQELDVSRGSVYVGRVKVVEAQPDKAIATVLAKYQQVPIQHDDFVGSELNSKVRLGKNN
jgi:hypothetical protein